MDVRSWRGEFPVVEQFIYLDHAGVAPVSRRVMLAVQNVIERSAKLGAFGYPAWGRDVDRTRVLAARLLKAEEQEIAFVRSTSHGLSLVAEGLAWEQGDNILVYELEFPSNLFPWMHLGRKGVETKFIRSRSGRIEIGDIAAMIDERTRLIAMSTVQFTNGFRVDLEALGRLCKERKVLFCVDAIQSLGATEMDVRRHNIDFLSADAHKWMMGPEGIGLFFCRKELIPSLEPALVGWRSVQNEFAFEDPAFQLKKSAQRFEEGSHNLLGIIGMGAAIELLLEVGIEKIERKVQELGEMVMREADARSFAVLTPRDRKERGGIVTVAGRFDPAAVRDALREKGIMVNVRAGGLRISPHFYTTEEEIARFFKTLDTIMDS